ncbi:MAG: amidase [Chrysiogenetes bacterium]|nr:amidase [Chrysiogenetes bacterium]
MAGFAEYTKHDALGLAGLVEKKEVTPLELVDSAIDAIERLNPQLNAVIHTFYDRAREAARGELPAGPFRGVPFLFKDLLTAYAGEEMCSGAGFYRGWKPAKNSELANRYLASGVVLLGKTNTPEFGLVPTTEPKAFGPTRNPWDTSRTTGGSSGGTGAAVASRMVPMAGGGDGGGSIRIPSAMNGIFGLKPTRGRTPVGPAESEGWHGFAIEHVLTRSVRDSAAMLDATCGPFLGDFHYLPKPHGKFLDEVGKDPGKLRIAYSAEPFLPGEVHTECRRAIAETVRKLEALGHECIEARPNFDGLAFSRNFLVMAAAYSWVNIKEAEDTRGRKAQFGEFEERTWLAARMGDVFSAGEFVYAIRRLQEAAREVLLFCEDYDVVLNPTTGAPPQKLGFLDAKGVNAVIEKVASRIPLGPLMKNGAALDANAAEVFSFIPHPPVYNVTGQPSMSVPLYWTDEHLPVGSMFTAKFGDEATLLRLAAQLEAAHPWADKKPPVSA